MQAYIAEFLGTALLIVFGNGVVSNVVLKDTKGNNSGWIVITFGWAMAVFIAVYSTAKISGAHLNPAVTLGLAICNKFPWMDVLPYMVAQISGACLGAMMVWVHYRDHFEITTDKVSVLACFSTSPAIRSSRHNFLSEVFATFIFMISILYITGAKESLGALDALPVALLVLGVGLSLGGNTGYAINPARDLGPRIAHALLPLKHKGGSEWNYAPIPVFGPLTGAALAGLLYCFLQ